MLCHSLINTRRSDLKTWAEEKLAIIEPAEETIEKHDLTSSDKLGSRINLKSISDFKRFCLANLMLILKEFEQKRTNAIITIALASICFIAIIYLIGKGFHLFHYIPKCSEVSFKQNNYVRYGSCYTITSYKLSLFTGLAIAFLLSTVVWIGFIHRTITLYSRGFKKRVIEKIINFIDPQERLAYVEQVCFGHLIKSDLPLVNIAVVNSKLFNTISGIPEHIQVDDCILGKIDHTEIFWSQISVQKSSGYDLFGILNNLDNLVWQLGIDNSFFKLLAKAMILILKLMVILLIPLILLDATRNLAITEYLQSNFGWGRKTIFKGLFFEADFPKSLERETFLHITTHNLTAQVAQQMQQKGEVVTLEDTTFNRLFLVRSNSQVEARYILSTSLMKRLTDFYQKVRKPLKVSFIGNKIYIAVSSEHHVFEPRLFKSMVSFAPLREYFITLNFMLAVVQDLNLNLKIWSRSNSYRRFHLNRLRF